MNQHRVYTELDELINLRLYCSQLSLRFDSRRLQQATGVHLSRFKGQGMDFAEYRQYQPGDDPRTIDWRVTARRGRTHTRIYHEEVERPVLIMTDQSSSMFFGSKHAFKSVRAAEFASLISWIGLQHGDRIGGLVFSDHSFQAIKPSRHPKQSLRLLECLNSFNNALSLNAMKDRSKHSKAFSLNDSLIELRRIARPGSQCFLISDWRQFNEESAKLLFELRRHCQVLAIRIFDPLETVFPAGQFQLSNGLQELELNTANQNIKHRYEQAYLNWEQYFNDHLAKVGVGCVQASTLDKPLTHLKSLQFGANVSTLDEVDQLEGQQ